MRFTSSFALLAAMVAASAYAQVAVVAPGTTLVIGVPTTTLAVTTIPTAVVLPGAGGVPTTTIALTGLPTVVVGGVPTTTTAVGTSTTLNGGTSTSLSTVSAPTSTVVMPNGSRADLVKVHHPRANGATFCRNWKSACVNYRPGGKLYFASTYCLPGDFGGKFPMHVATVNCRFSNGTDITTVNNHVAREMGAYVYRD